MEKFSRSRHTHSTFNIKGQVKWKIVRLSEISKDTREKKENSSFAVILDRINYLVFFEFQFRCRLSSLLCSHSLSPLDSTLTKVNFNYLSVFPFQVSVKSDFQLEYLDSCQRENVKSAIFSLQILWETVTFPVWSFLTLWPSWVQEEMEEDKKSNIKPIRILYNYRLSKLFVVGYG